MLCLRSQTGRKRLIVPVRIGHVRTALKFAVCIGLGLFIASLPSGSILGIIGSVSLMAIGTVGCIETEA